METVWGRFWMLLSGSVVLPLQMVQSKQNHPRGAHETVTGAFVGFAGDAAWCTSMGCSNTVPAPSLPSRQVSAGVSTTSERQVQKAPGASIWKDAHVFTEGE